MRAGATCSANDAPPSQTLGGAHEDHCVPIGGCDANSIPYAKLLKAQGQGAGAGGKAGG